MAVLGPREPPSEGRASRKSLAAPLAFAVLVALLGAFATAATHGVLAQAPQGQNVTYITGCTNITSPGHYVISSNISGTQAAGYCIGVFASDVVINGNSHWLTGPRNGEGVGIYAAPGSTNVTIEDVVIAWYNTGIVVSSSGVRVVDSTVSGSWYGVNVTGTHDSIANSTVSYSYWYGVYVNGDNDSIVDSTVSHNFWYGVHVGSNDSIVDSNVSYSIVGVNITGNNDSIVDSIVDFNGHGVIVTGSYNRFVGDRFQGDGIFLVGPYYEVVSNDTVNGRPLVYLYNASNVTVRDAGQVIAVDSRNVRVVGVNVSNATVGVQLWDVNDSTIEGVVASGDLVGVNITGNNDSIAYSNVSHNGWYGVYVVGSDNSVIDSTVSDNYWTGVNITGNNDSIAYSNVSDDHGYGVYVTGVNDSIANSNVTYNDYGIYLYDDSGTLITGNIISNNAGCSLIMDGSRGDLIYNNLFNNTLNVCIARSYAHWNVSLRPGRNIVGGDMIGGNAWLSPSGDGFSQVTPALPNDPYICDEPYVISGNNTDYLPLKYPFSNTSTTTTTTMTTPPPTTTSTTSTATTTTSTATTTTTTTSTTTTTPTTTSTFSTTTTSATATSTSIQTPSTPVASTAPGVTTSSPTTASATSARPSLSSIALVAAAVVVVVAAAVAFLLRGRR